MPSIKDISEGIHEDYVIRLERIEEKIQKVCDAYAYYLAVESKNNQEREELSCLQNKYKET